MQKNSLAVYINRLYSLSNITTSVIVCYTTPDKFQTLWFIIPWVSAGIFHTHNKLPYFILLLGHFGVSHRLYQYISQSTMVAITV